MPHNWKEEFDIIMPSSGSKISRVLLFLCMLSLFSISAEAITTYRYHICANSSLYTPNGTYQSNLDILFSSLSSNASRSSGFYNTTAGRNTPDAAYGLFLCRGDVAADLCRECVDAASKEILRRCPVDKRAYMWFDECMLRYSDQSIFSRLADSPSPGLWNSQNITDPSRFMELMMETMNGLVTRAAVTDGSGKKFATEDANFTSFQRLYTLAQCTPDLTQADCNRCLQVAVAQLPSCCDGKMGGRVLTPSCNVRYETYPFYQNAVAAPPPAPIITFSPPPPTIPIASPEGNGKLSTQTIVAIVVSVSFSVMLLSIGCCFLVRKARKKYDAIAEDNVGNEITTVQSLQFDLRTIGAATKNFSDDNKIGEGGFGSVYKGILPNGQEIAVKRLARGSGQGGEEFKNEVVLLAKLQHRNLVRLLGFCLEGEEKILIYEFVTNKSLDYFLFDLKKQRQLDWSRRYKIIGGIARGILYLHEDSRLRIIHRDLKASNILLDEDMNPKISDFGMARIFGVDQTQANTNRVVGTFGYMAPEYAMHGHFSVKSDVFSFGVLVLEIISGKKNSSFHRSDHAEDLLSYTWKLWREGTPLELKDPTLGNSYSRNEVLRCINIGLLCVQEDVDARPSMSSVVVMLNSFSVTLPLPRRPPFLASSRTQSQIPQGLLSDQSTTKSIPLSVNEASITELHPR